MNGNIGIGRAGIFLAALIAIGMAIGSYIVRPVEIAPVQNGLCLDSPDFWDIEPVFSWLINSAVIGIITLLMYFINKSYNFIRTTEPALFAVFLIMAASNPWFTEKLNASSLVCLVNVVCLGVAFSAYDSKNATQQMFVLGIAAGIGSMFQYAFIPMACVYFLWALVLKVMRLKETLAFILGIACPYWIALGFGWLTFNDFHYPFLVPFFNIVEDYTDTLFLFLGIGLAAIIGFMTGLPNLVRLYAGNSKVNAMNLCVSLLGIVSMICIIVDYENLPAYVLTLYLATAVQIANICALWNVRYDIAVTVIPSLLFISLYLGNIFL